MPRDFLPRLKLELDRTLTSYRKIASLRQRKIDQDLEQIKVYLNILESQSEKIAVRTRSAKKIGRVLAWKPGSTGKDMLHRKQQDELENHLLEIQKVLVGLISRRFKY